MTDVIHQSRGFFDDLNAPQRGLLPLQAVTSDPTLPTLQSATGLLATDETPDQRLAHFDPLLYDMRPQSHLVRLMRILLGDAGAGQLRKRYTIARLRTVMGSTHFYDLDGFYGALLGATRKADEQLPMNPATSIATQDEWDEIAVKDGNYRERIYALAKALPLAGTLPGLQQAAEALTSAPCDIYETWKIIESGVIIKPPRTWDQVEDLYANFDGFQSDHATWATVGDESKIGVVGTNNRDEIVVRVKKQYVPVDGSPGALRDTQRQREEDAMYVHRVLDRLKPAGVLLSVDLGQIETKIVTPISGLSADSEFWEIVTRTTPRPGLGTIDSPYFKTSDDGTVRSAGPPFTVMEGFEWTHNGSITSVNSYAMQAETDAVDAIGTVLDASNWESSVSRLLSNEEFNYLPKDAIADQRALLGAQATAPSALTVNPYSDPRGDYYYHQRPMSLDFETGLVGT